MKPLLSLPALAFVLLAGPAAAQLSAARFKTPRLVPAGTPVEHPRNIQRRIDGRTTAQLSRATGPLATAPGARLAAWPTSAPPPTSEQNLSVQRDPATGLPICITAAPLTGHQRARVQAPVEATRSFLRGLANVLGVREPDQEFAVMSVSTPDAVGQTHVRLRQTWTGLPVYGAEVVLHLDGAGQPLSLTGRHFRSPAGVTTQPALTATTAARRAETGLRTRTRVHLLTAAEQQLLHYAGPVSELVVYHPEGATTPVLTWHVTTYANVLERWETFVDATNGAVVAQYASSCTTNGPRTATAPDLNGATQTLNTYELNGTFYLLDASRSMFNAGTSNLPDHPIGGILTADAQGTNRTNFAMSHVTSTANAWTSTGRPAAVSAHFNGGRAFEYYSSTFNRNSIDGQGGTILSVVHLADDNGGGLDNAFWNGQFIVYGDGANAFLPLAGGLDVAGHEMTHGVIQHSANLEYLNQSGALNEHMADVFGAMIDRNDWLMGEDIVQPGVFPGGALRSLQDPHNGTSSSGNGWQPRTMAEFYAGSDDNGGVHINSGIPNWAFFKFATAVSKEHAEQVWYRALTTYLTRSSRFLDLRIATIQAATDLYGAGAPDIAALGAAFDAVGIFGTTPPPTAQVLPTNPGTEFLLAYNTDASLSGTLYLGTSAGAGFQQITTTPAITKPSVTDDGQQAAFVDDQHHIRLVNLTGSPNETVISNQPIWHSVALSKDGAKLAAVTVGQDTAIYVFDLASGNGVRYQLYIPTTGGAAGTGVLRADALEWDYTGQYVIYDAYNVIQTASGQDYDFWNINFLRAWDNPTHDWGSGNIEQLVPSLPDGISIGNPVLSKKSPNIIAFDRLDANASSFPFSVMALNLETSDVGLIFEGSNVPGTPTYSKLDDQVMFTALSVSGDTVIAQTAMAADKITPTGNPSVLVTAAKWPTLLAQGTRTLPTAAPTELPEAVALNAWPNPVHDALLVEAARPVSVTLFDGLGRAVRTARVPAGQPQQLNLSDLPAGPYLLRAVDENQRTTTRRIVKD